MASKYDRDPSTLPCSSQPGTPRSEPPTPRRSTPRINIDFGRISSPGYPFPVTGNVVPVQRRPWGISRRKVLLFTGSAIIVFFLFFTTFHDDQYDALDGRPPTARERDLLFSTFRKSASSRGGKKNRYLPLDGGVASQNEISRLPSQLIGYFDDASLSSEIPRGPHGEDPYLIPLPSMFKDSQNVLSMTIKDLSNLALEVSNQNGKGSEGLGRPECKMNEKLLERYKPLWEAPSLMESVVAVGKDSWLGRLIGNFESSAGRLFTGQQDRNFVRSPADYTKSTFLIAINLSSAQSTIPSLINSLQTLAKYLGPSRFYVSIYENGSREDDGTPQGLYILAKILDKLRVRYRIIIKGKGERSVGEGKPGERIFTLAKLRNELLKPLESGYGNHNTSSSTDDRISKDYQFRTPRGTFTDVIFLNDVIHCPSDIFEVLLTKMRQSRGVGVSQGGEGYAKAEMACAMDFQELRIEAFEPNYPMLFYDMWVARDMLGQTLYRIQDGGHWDLPGGVQPFEQQNYPSYERYESGLPIQVFSCWNGIAVISARAFEDPLKQQLQSSTSSPEETLFNTKVKFIGNHHHTFETTEGRDDGLPKGIKFRALNDDDIASECFLFCSDLWKTGMGRIVVTPLAKVGYTLEEYERVRVRWDGIAKWFGWEDDDERKDDLVRWRPYPPKLVAWYEYGWWDHETWKPPW